MLGRSLSGREYGILASGVIVLMKYRYYVLREEMLRSLTDLAAQQLQSNVPWQVSRFTVGLRLV
jgi:hypothetical protein